MSNRKGMVSILDEPEEEIKERVFYEVCPECGHYSLASGKAWQKCADCKVIFPVTK